MSQSFVKIMKSFDDDVKEHIIIPIASGDIVEFRMYPMPAVWLNGVVHCEIEGPAYMMNENGKTISTFAPHPPIQVIEEVNEPYVKAIIDVSEYMSKSTIDVGNYSIRGEVAATILEEKGIPQVVLDVKNMERVCGDTSKTFLIQTVEHNYILTYLHRGIMGWVFAALHQPIDFGKVIS